MRRGVISHPSLPRVTRHRGAALVLPNALSMEGLGGCFIEDVFVVQQIFRREAAEDDLLNRRGGA